MSYLTLLGRCVERWGEGGGGGGRGGARLEEDASKQASAQPAREPAQIESDLTGHFFFDLELPGRKHTRHLLAFLLKAVFYKEQFAFWGIRGVRNLIRERGGGRFWA